MELGASMSQEPSYSTLRAQEKVDRVTLLVAYCEKELKQVQDRLRNVAEEIKNHTVAAGPGSTLLQ